MNREEKNQQTKTCIMDSALSIFSKDGYWAGSVNSICELGKISKGIIYHYFETKDDLYLSCVDECFEKMTEYLKETVSMERFNIHGQLEDYFTSKMNFFRTYPVYQQIYCEAVNKPPVHLVSEIEKIKKEYDELNKEILNFLFGQFFLRPGVSNAEVTDTFLEFNYLIDPNLEFASLSSREFEKYEEKLLKSLNILLYGCLAAGE